MYNNRKYIKQNRSISNVVKFFPNIELSYEKNIHNKVQSDIYLLIPKGKKCFVWFKHFNNQPCCFVLTIHLKTKKFTNIEKITTAFDTTLCSGKGTILYGTKFNINDTNCFTIENIFYYKGKNLQNLNQYNKFNYINDLTNFISQKKIIQKQLIIGTPIICDNLDDIYKKAENVPYTIYSIQHRLLFINKPFLNLRYKSNKEIFKNFKIKATIVNDIYELYCLNNSTYEKIGRAYIPSYKTSVMMNNYFRNIKENFNLDALEESDSEEEFENTNIDKFVDLDKSYIFKCVYNEKFNGWVPIEKTSEKFRLKKKLFW